MKFILLSDVKQKNIFPLLASSFLRQLAGSFGMTIYLYSCRGKGGDQNPHFNLK